MSDYRTMSHEQLMEEVNKSKQTLEKPVKSTQDRIDRLWARTVLLDIARELNHRKERARLRHMVHKEI